MQTNKSSRSSKKSYSPYLTEGIKIVLPILAIIFLGFVSQPTSALTYQDSIGVQFTFNPTININLSSSDLIINNLTPGNAADSNIITINVATNNAYGYVLSATTGSTSNATTDLAQSGTNNKFSSIATNASLASLTTDNTWGYSFSINSGSSWSNYSGLPLYTAASGAELVNNDGTGSTPVQFKIAARASNEQASGTYTNVINFTAVVNPEPTPEPISCDAGKICYSSNALNSEGTMGEQTASSNTNTDLLASNFSRTGYGFAGWSPTMDGTGAKYGPNETINPGDLSEHGLALYAMWVPSAGTIQNWSGCSGLASGAVTALTDSRDNNTYAVAKLADGNCWMIENLRLADKDSNNSDIELSSTNTNNPSLPLTNNYANSTTSNHLSASINPTTTAWCTTNSAACDDQSMLYTGNATERGSSPTSSANTYSYGNYYNWYSATAGNGKYSTSTNNSNTAGDICPSGWSLPVGGQNTVNTNNNFYILTKTLMGNAEPNQDNSNGYGYYDNTPINANGDTATKAIRKYPNNFLYSGSVYGSSVNDRGSYGNYWSMSAYSNNSADYLSFYSSFVNPSSYNNKNNGFSVRCLTE